MIAHATLKYPLPYIPVEKRTFLPRHNVCSIAPAEDASDNFITGNGALRMQMTGRPYHEVVTYGHEELYMPKWVKTPEPPDLRPVLPEGTRVLDLTVRSGVCYLNLSPGAQLPEGITPELSLYGIVDSLTTVTNITSVQLLIDNSQEGSYFGIPVKDAFPHNLDYIAP